MKEKVAQLLIAECTSSEDEVEGEKNTVVVKRLTFLSDEAVRIKSRLDVHYCATAKSSAKARLRKVAQVVESTRGPPTVCPAWILKDFQ